MSEKITRFDPQESAIKTEKAALVLMPHMGSSIQGDTGRDAQDLANRLALPVYAVGRPGSGITLPNPRLKASLARDYVAAHAELGKKLNRELESDGITGVTLFGRSAGGLGVSALVNTETLPVYGLQANEAPGWYGIPVKDGKVLHKTYNSMQKEAFQLDGTRKLVHPDPSDQTGLDSVRRIASIAASVPTDIYHNETVWNQPLMRSQAQRIASDMPLVDTVYGFAETSMMTTDGLIEELAAELTSLRDAASKGVEDARPLQVIKYPNTLHASFDKRAFAAKTISPLVDRMLASIE